jgi:hypothetical protein
LIVEVSAFIITVSPPFSSTIQLTVASQVPLPIVTVGVFPVSAKKKK